MKRFGLKLLVLAMCALLAQTALAFECFYAPAINKILNLTIVEPLPDDGVSWLATGGLQFRNSQEQVNALLSAAPDLRPASPFAESRSDRMGFHAFAVVGDTSVSPERATKMNYRRQQNRERHFKQFRRWRPLPPAVWKMLG
jgi:hypothetical protein